MRAVRFIVLVLAVLAVLVAAAFLLRHQIVGGVIRSAMASAGLENPKATVSALSLSRIELRDVAAGPQGGEGFRFGRIEATYDWRALLSDRRVKTVTAGPGAINVQLGADGGVSLPGVMLGGGGSGGGALPFDKLTLDDVALTVAGQEGEARGAVSGAYDAASGGAAKLSLAADRFGFGKGVLEAADFSADIILEADGRAHGAGAFNGDIVIGAGALRDIALTFDGAGSSWRDVAEGARDAFTGEAMIALRGATASVDEIEALAALTQEQNALIFGTPVTTLTASGDIGLVLSAEGLSVSAGEDPLSIRADNGAALEFTPVEDAPLYSGAGETAEAGFVFELSGAAVSALGSVSARQGENGWLVFAPVRIGEYRSPALSMDDASAMIRLTANEASIVGDITTTTNLRALSIGRFSVADAPLTTDFAVVVDRAAKTTTLSLPQGRCIRSDRARFALEGQDTEASFKNMRLCGGDAPLAVIDWSGPLHTDFSGALAADEIRYRLGQTRISGAPPMIGFSGDYNPALHQTLMNGTMNGGALTFNDFLNLTAAQGHFDFSLDSSMMRANGWIDSVRIVQNMEAPLVAPVIGSGDLRLEGDKAAFRYTLKSTGGAKLGVGEGSHDVASAKGQTVFTFDRLEFQKRGLQPEKLAPVLRGVVGATTGAAKGVATFAWSPGELTSKASIAFEDITFVGPTRIVEMTSGLNGEIAFSQLWPVATEGVQTVTIDSIGFYVPVPLKNGTVSFDLPGDETLHVHEAEFPWFGGALGVYEADMSIAGDRASIPLRADDIDVSQVLEFVDVEGLTGDGVLSGVLPLVVENGKAKIVGGVLTSNGPGFVSYVGQAATQASAAGEQPKTAFDLLRDLRYTSLKVTVDGPLDGRIDFRMEFNGEGTLHRNRQDVRVPVNYRITLDAALLELLNQAALSRDIKLQIERAISGEE